MFHRLSHREAGSDTWLTPTFVNDKVKAGFSFRTGGKSSSPYNSLNLSYRVGDESDAVLQNRQRVAERGFGPVDEWVFAKQVHGNGVAVVGKPDRGAGSLPDSEPVPECDALVTNDPQTTLVVLVADCVPVLFYDPVHQAIGAAHSGWRGTTSHIVQQVYFHMNFFYQTRPSDLLVSIGPSIRRCCYEVDDKVAVPVRNEFGHAFLTRRQHSPDKYFLSLQACIHRDLTQLGVLEENIEDAGLCTSCHTDLLFSHRAEHGKTGRSCGLIRLTGEED